jgi:hypothetical protein
VLIGGGVLGDCESLDINGLMAGWIVIFIRIVFNVNNYQGVSVKVRLSCTLGFWGLCMNICEGDCNGVYL